MGVNKFNLLTKYHDVTSFLCSVVESADQNRNALGFYPASVFEEFARSEQLYVIAERRGNKAKYAGHLLFDCRYPKASILLIFVITSNRGSGVAGMLLNPLGLDITFDVETPLALLDLNVLFDLGPRRIRHEDALDLFRAELMGQCRFAISKELSEELKRTATSGRTDPMQFYPMI